MNNIMDTSDPKFPHHWDCQYTTGHPNEDRECIVGDGTTRFPDGSIVAKSEIRAGGVFIAAYDLNRPSPTIYEVKTTQ